ncbi:MAG: magnesium transporter, partial [Myxococcota bacterium]
QETVARLVARYNLLALPVVDDNNVLAGIVTVDDVIDVIREEATEDMFRMAGAGDTPFGFDAQSIFASTRSRLPWLFASWIGGVLAGVIIQGYEERLLQVAALAAFIPVIIGMAGNVGTQSLTVVTRGLALGQIDARQVLKVVGRELSVGILCGVIYGALLGLAGAALISLQGGQVDPWRFGLSVGLALCSGMLIAAVVGGAVPMLLHRLSIDPAVATGPFVTTSVDILGVLVYFNFATILLGL